MSHPNRNWKRRWVVDPVARTASHVDGWVFQFAAEPDAEGGTDGRCVKHPNLIGYIKPASPTCATEHNATAQ